MLDAPCRRRNQLTTWSKLRMEAASRQVKAVRAAFRAGITPPRIARHLLEISRTHNVER